MGVKRNECRLTVPIGKVWSETPALLMNHPRVGEYFKLLSFFRIGDVVSTGIARK